MKVVFNSWFQKLDNHKNQLNGEIIKLWFGLFLLFHHTVWGDNAIMGKTPEFKKKNILNMEVFLKP